MSTTHIVNLPDDRELAYEDFGPGGGRPVVWCHGGPGSRLEPLGVAAEAHDAGIRIIGVDRPGYGKSSPQPNRAIADWVPDALAVLDDLGIDRATFVGISTGGAYALATASIAPERVDAVLVCCGLTDMAWPEAALHQPPSDATEAIWNAPDRESAIAIARQVFGDDGMRPLSGADSEVAVELAPADMALLGDAAMAGGFFANMQEAFVSGHEGYTDDRRADGVGWITFDVSAVRCPVLVIHGTDDTLVPVAQGHHTAAIVPGARLDVREGEGHLSMVGQVVGALRTFP